MLIMLSGNVTDVRLLDKKAEYHMLVTGRPLVSLGMMTAPPEPVYPVMVIAPLLVTKRN